MPATACSTSLLSANSFDRPEPSRFSLPIKPSRPVLATFSRNTSLSPLVMTVSLGLASLRPILPAFSLAFFIWPSSVFFCSSFFFSARWCDATFSCSIGASSFTSCAGVSASVLGGSLFHINVSNVANRPTMIVAVVTVRRSSGSSWRGRPMVSGSSTKRSSTRRSRASGRLMRARSPGPIVTSRSAPARRRCGGPASRSVTAIVWPACWMSPVMPGASCTM